MYCERSSSDPELCEQREQAPLFSDAGRASRTDIKLFDDVEQLCWGGPKPEFDALAAQLDAARGESRSAEGRKAVRGPTSKLRTSSPN
jgi:hypothetical protein